MQTFAPFYVSGLICRGLVVGWDAQCCESDEWAEAVGVASLPRGSKQPFYQLLVDVRDWSFDYTLPPVAYVGACRVAQVLPCLVDERTNFVEIQSLLFF